MKTYFLEYNEYRKLKNSLKEKFTIFNNETEEEYDWLNFHKCIIDTLNNFGETSDIAPYKVQFFYSDEWWSSCVDNILVCDKNALTIQFFEEISKLMNNFDNKCLNFQTDTDDYGFRHRFKHNYRFMFFNKNNIAFTIYDLKVEEIIIEYKKILTKKAFNLLIENQ